MKRASPTGLAQRTAIAVAGTLLPSSRTSAVSVAQIHAAGSSRSARRRTNRPGPPSAAEIAIT